MIRIIIALYSLSLVMLGSLQQPPAGRTLEPCRAPVYRQFDFWIGDWEVFSPDGKVAGHNVVMGTERGRSRLRPRSVPVVQLNPIKALRNALVFRVRQSDSRRTRRRSPATRPGLPG